MFKKLRKNHYNKRSNFNMIKSVMYIMLACDTSCVDEKQKYLDRATEYIERSNDNLNKIKAL